MVLGLAQLKRRAVTQSIVMIDPVTGEIIDQRQIPEQLLAQAKKQGVSLVGPGGLLRRLTKTVLEPRSRRR